MQREEELLELFRTCAHRAGYDSWYLQTSILLGSLVMPALVVVLGTPVDSPYIGD